MKVEFTKSFLKDLKKIKDKRLKTSLSSVIQEVETAKQLLDISNCKKLTGSTSHYRIRIGSYRVGIKLENQTIVFVTFGDRKEIYKYFP
jgi:mRNA interferase RelE/StbE